MATTTTTVEISAPPVLRVGIEEARGLLVGDYNGLSDPFVLLQLLDHRGDVVAGAPTVKTAIKTKTLSPVWNESAVLGDGALDLRVVTTLRFVVYDFDALKRDDTLGVVDIPMEIALQLADDGSDEWFQVRKFETQMTQDATGELRLTFARLPAGYRALEAAQQDAEKNRDETETPVEDTGEPNLLYVTIDSGRDLLPMDDDQHSDPIVKLSLTGQLFQTTSVAKTLKPHWDERFAFVVRDPHTSLELVVEDDDLVKNDLLGRATLVLADVIPNAQEEVKLDVVLLNDKLVQDKDRGVLHVRLRWVYDPHSETVARSMRKKRKQQTPSMFQQLTTKLRLAVPDLQQPQPGDDHVDDDEREIARVNDADGVIEDESDHEELALQEQEDGTRKTIRFAAITVHRAEQLPPLDALHFDKSATKDRKPTAPGGGIDAYVAGWLSGDQKNAVRTRIHTRKGRRDELTTNFHETLLLALPAPTVAPVVETKAKAHGDHAPKTGVVEVKEMEAQKETEMETGAVSVETVDVTMAEEQPPTETKAETAVVVETTREPELETPRTPVDVTLAVMDWDSIGGDEVVSHVELCDIESLVVNMQHKPFWVNLYGAPLLGVKNKQAVDTTNTTSDAGSTYRGRVLLTLKIVTKPLATYDDRHQKRRAKPLPRELFPASSIYRLRAHFLSAIGLPEPTGKYYVTLSCGMHEISSAQKPAHNRAVEWNETEESDRLLFPNDAAQIPDVVLSLCTGEWEKRVVVSFTRFRAADLLAKEFTDTAVAWVPLVADATTEAVPRDMFPGKVLLRLGFGTLAKANAQVWDQKAMTEVVSRRVPYQIRVRVHGMRDGSGATPRKTPVQLRVQCGDKELLANGVVLDATEVSTVFALDVNLPQLAFASQVLVHVSDDAEAEPSSSSFIGTLAVSLHEAADGEATIVTHCSSEQLKSNTRPKTPTAAWLPLVALDGSVQATQLLASVEVIRKMFPDQKLPEPEAVVAAAQAC